MSIQEARDDGLRKIGLAIKKKLPNATCTTEGVEKTTIF